MGKPVNKRELAEFLGYSERALTDMQAEADPLPIEKKGERGEENEYDTEAVVKWLIDRQVKKAGKGESQRDRLTRLQADAIEMDNKVKEGELVPASMIEPVWRDRVLSAAGFMASRASRLAGILEAAPGIEAKRKILKEEDAAFLTKLGVDGERMQAEIEQLLQRFSEEEAADLLRRIAGNDSTPGPGGSDKPDLGDADPAEEDPPE